MKKLLSFLLSVCLICALIVPAHAAGVNISISASASSVKRGDTVTFTVSVSGSEAVTHFGLALEYDTSVFEMVDGECTADAWYPDFTPSNGFAVMYKDPTVPSGTIGWFTLRAKKDATLGSSWVGGSASAKNGAATVSSSAGGATVTVFCAHSYGSWTKVDGTNHKHTCSACGNEESAAHTWDSGKVTTPATCQATGEALFTCTGCGATKTEPVPLGDHKYSAWSKVDDSKHTHTCSVCSKEETVNHSWNGGTTVKAANCITDGEMRYTCTGCGATRTQTVSKTGVHTYDHGCDKDCNVCGATRTTTHDFSEDWVSDKNGHWHECTNCGEKSDAAAHIPGPEPTDTTDQVCTACAYIIKPSLNHEHVYADKLTGDESGHWYPCAQCDDQKDFAPHDFDNDCDMLCDTCRFKRTVEHKWSETWSGDENAHWYACTVCGQKNEETSHDWRRGVCTVCQAADPNYEPFTLPFWAWLIIGFALGCGFTSLLFLLGRKRSKDERNDDPPSGGKPAKEAPVKTDKPAKPAKADKPVKPAEPVPVAPARKAKAEPAAASAVTVEEISAESLMAEFSSSKSTPVKTEPVKTEPAKAQPAKPKAAPVMPNPLKAKPVVADPDSTEAMFKEEPVKAQPAKAEPAKPKAAPVMPNPLKARPVVADPDSTEAMFKAESSDRAESLFKAAPLMSTPGKTKPAAPVTPKTKSAPSVPIATAPEASGAADPDADISSEVQILSNWKPF